MTTHQTTTRQNQSTLPAALWARIDGVHTQMLDIIERMLAQLAAPQADAPPLLAARRQIANTLGLWRLCARPKCSRSRCCRGEPKECLQGALPLLPPETIARLLGGKKERRRARTALVPQARA